MSPRIVLVHGAATGPGVWARAIDALARRGHRDVVAVARPCSGDLDTELRALAPLAEGAVVVGQSGGATLALALAASGVRMAAALSHEPAVGSLVPGLLAPVASAYAERGLEGFGEALYGPAWNPSFAPDTAAVGRELPMFRRFEPARAARGQGPVVTTVGSRSPALRHQAAAALRDRLGYDMRVLEGAAHFIAWEAPDTLADAVDRLVGEAGGYSPASPPSRWPNERPSPR